MNVHNGTAAEFVEAVDNAYVILHNAIRIKQRQSDRHRLVIMQRQKSYKGVQTRLRGIVASLLVSGFNDSCGERIAECQAALNQARSLIESETIGDFARALVHVNGSLAVLVDESTQTPKVVVKQEVKNTCALQSRLSPKKEQSRKRDEAKKQDEAKKMKVRHVLGLSSHKIVGNRKKTKLLGTSSQKKDPTCKQTGQAEARGRVKGVKRAFVPPTTSKLGGSDLSTLLGTSLALTPESKRRKLERGGVTGKRGRGSGDRDVVRKSQSASITSLTSLSHSLGGGLFLSSKKGKVSTIHKRSAAAPAAAPREKRRGKRRKKPDREDDNGSVVV